MFVEEFILDRTLDPAIDEFGLDKVRMIDPTCGSGHFLLGGFARLFDLWMKRESNEIVAAQKALDGVWGVDINPFAVAIARFRLIVAAVAGLRDQAAEGRPRLEDSPGDRRQPAVRQPLEPAVARRSRSRRGSPPTREVGLPRSTPCEDKDALQEVLGQQYHAVVGNPPYITVKDSALNEAYRDRTATCHRQVLAWRAVHRAVLRPGPRRRRTGGAATSA